MSSKKKGKAAQGHKAEDEQTQREKIDQLLDEGYTPLQIEKEWGYPHSTVREIAKKRITPKGTAQGGEKEDNTALPVVLKTGQGREVITPEGIMQRHLLGDGDHGAAMLQGMILLRAAQLMVMNDVEIMKGQAEAQSTALKPILEIMEKAREDMDAAAERARHSTEEAAASAAAAAAARAAAHIDQRFDELKHQKKDIAETEKPMEGVMARTMEIVMQRLQGMMFGGQVDQTPGMVDKRTEGGK
jgi:hypothetical protein